MNRQIHEEASGWLVELRTETPDAAARRRFEAWLSKSPEHVRAYLEVSSIWEVGSTPVSDAPTDASEIDALIERARATPNVVTLTAEAERASQAPAGEATRSRRPAFFAAAAALLLTVLGIGGYVYTQRNVYTTAIGEQRSILLPDGSTIDLNARSRVRVQLSERERHIDLIEGQALFRVARDKVRPFIVAANGTWVRAVGTAFDVNQRKRGVVVTVVEGTVAVVEGRASPALVTAGQQVTLDAAAPERRAHLVPQPQPADVDTATAWTQRRLIFNATRLDEVAEEFNRNNTRPLVIDGDGLDDFHVSGAFSSTDPEPILRFLRTQPGIVVTDERDRIVVSRKP